MAVNHLADKTDKELNAFYGKQYSGVYNGGKPFPYSSIAKTALPEQFDWRIFGAVTPVKGKHHILRIDMKQKILQLLGIKTLN